jgi:hypothetical protein
MRWSPAATVAGDLLEVEHNVAIVRLIRRSNIPIALLRVKLGFRRLYETESPAKTCQEAARRGRQRQPLAVFPYSHSEPPRLL